MILNNSEYHSGNFQTLNKLYPFYSVHTVILSSNTVPAYTKQSFLLIIGPCNCFIRPVYQTRRRKEMDKTKLHTGMEKAVKQSASHRKQSPLILGDILLSICYYQLPSNIIIRREIHSFIITINRPTFCRL